MPGAFCTAVKKVQARLKNPPYTAKQYLATLAQQGLVATVLKLEQFSELI
jgi:DNA-binding IclR family transcriptional regulator